MANSKITWNDKVSLVTDPTIAEINKVTDSNMNEIKSVVNENADQLIISDTEPTSNDNEIWVDTSSNATYMNQEVNIGPTNVSNTPVWFKVGKNLFNANETDRGYLNVSNGNVVTSNDWKTTWFITIPVGTDHITIIGNKGSQEGYCFYNSSQAFLSGGSMGSSTSKNISIPTNAKYFKITVSNDVLTSYAIYFNGETTDTYEPYIAPEIIINNRSIYNSDSLYGVELYNAGTSATALNSFSIVETITNFKYVDVYFCQAGGNARPCVTRLFVFGGRIYVAPVSMLFTSANHDSLEIRTCLMTINNKSVTLERNYSLSFSNGSVSAADNGVAVIKIIGYK